MFDAMNRNAAECPKTNYASDTLASAAGSAIGCGSPVAPESEVMHAARLASESLMRLEKSIHALADKLETVLIQVPPSGPDSAQTAQRSVSSRMAMALQQHANQIDSLERYVSGLRERVAL